MLIYFYNFVIFVLGFLFVSKKLNMVCYILQSSICVKQLGYGILELLLISVFPELRNLVLDVHEKMNIPQSV